MEVGNQKGRAEWRLSGTITIKKMIKNQFLESADLGFRKSKRQRRSESQYCP